MFVEPLLTQCVFVDEVIKQQIVEKAFVRMIWQGGGGAGVLVAHSHISSRAEVWG